MSGRHHPLLRWLAAFRRRYSLTVVDLASLLGISARQHYRVRSGQCPLTLPMLERLMSVVDDDEALALGHAVVLAARTGFAPTGQARSR